MAEASSQFSPQLQKTLKQLGIGFETDKEFGEVTADFYIETGLFSKAVIFFVKTMNKETLKFNEKIMKNSRYFFRKIIILVDENMSKFWLDVTAMYTHKNKNFSFINISSKTIIGKIPEKVYKIFENISFPGGFWDKINYYPLPEISAMVKEIDEKSQNVWLHKLADYFKKYLVASGSDTSKVKNFENLSIDLVNDKGLIFVLELTEEVLDKGIKALKTLRTDIQKLTIVGVTARKSVLDSTRDGISIYALHRNYQWVSGKRKDRNSELEDFLRVHSNINLVKYKYPFSLKPILIPGFTILLLFIFGIIGIQYLLSREGFIIFLIFGITLFVSILLGGFSCKYMKVGQKEYTPAIIYAGSSGLILAAIFWVITTKYLPDVDIGYFLNEKLYLTVQSVLYVDFSIAVGILYAFFTKSQSSYIQPLPEEYDEVVAGKNPEIIKTAINSWDRGWALTIPDFASKIVTRTVNVFVGYTVILDTLFEKRWVSIGESSCYFGEQRSYEEAETAAKAKIASEEAFLSIHKFSHSSGFDEFSENLNVTWKAESGKCPDCNGNGRLLCGTCGGSGEETYIDFYTDYYADLPDHLRPNTHLTDHLTDHLSGPRKTRTAYRTVYRKRICSGCVGIGSVICKRCRGSGFIELYPVFNCKHFSKQHREIIDPTAGKRLEEVINKASSKVSIETPIKDGLLKADEIFGKDIPQEAVNLVQRLMNTVEQSQAPQINIIRQRLRLLKIPISEIDYSYKGKAYRLCVYGYDNKVHTLKSPINLFRLLITITVVLITLGINIIALWPVLESF